MKGATQILKKTEDIEIEFLKWFRLKGTFKGEALSAEGSLFGILRHFEFLIRGIYKNPKGDLCAELEVGLIWLGCEITLQQMERIIELHISLYSFSKRIKIRREFDVRRIQFRFITLA